MINYVKGSPVDPVTKDGLRVIAHVVNDLGRWDTPLCRHISKKWKNVEKFYLKQSRFAKRTFKRGEVQWVFVENNLAVCSMIALSRQPILFDVAGYPNRDEDLERCLSKLSRGAIAAAEGASISLHMPKNGFVTRKWSEIESLIEKHLSDFAVCIYD